MNVLGEDLVALTLVPVIATASKVIAIALLQSSLAVTGAGILNVLEVTLVNPELVKAILAPVIEAVLVAVKSLKVAVPLLLDGLVVPPIVHVPVPTAAFTLAVLVVALLYWS